MLSSSGNINMENLAAIFGAMRKKFGAGTKARSVSRELREKKMSDAEDIKKMIQSAFAHVEYPGDWCLIGIDRGYEPSLVEAAFKGKTDWSELDAAFLDIVPDGLATALCFFSDEALHFYLPAYLIADCDGLLDRTDVLFHLTHGLDDKSRSTLANQRRYGQRTWSDIKRYTWSVLNKAECTAIVAYLRFKQNSADLVDFEREHIQQALHNYWNSRIE